MGGVRLIVTLVAVYGVRCEPEAIIYQLLLSIKRIMLS